VCGGVEWVGGWVGGGGGGGVWGTAPTAPLMQGGAPPGVVAGAQQAAAVLAPPGVRAGPGAGARAAWVAAAAGPRHAPPRWTVAGRAAPAGVPAPPQQPPGPPPWWVGAGPVRPPCWRVPGAGAVAPRSPHRHPRPRLGWRDRLPPQPPLPPRRQTRPRPRPPRPGQTAAGAREAGGLQVGGQAVAARVAAGEQGLWAAALAAAPRDAGTWRARSPSRCRGLPRGRHPRQHHRPARRSTTPRPRPTARAAGRPWPG
jgi:hypothetical protein